MASSCCSWTDLEDSPQGWITRALLRFLIMKHASLATGIDESFIVTDVLSPAHPILWRKNERLQFVAICQ